MTGKVGSPRYLALLDQMRDLHLAKNAGYAGVDAPDPWANFRGAEGWGVSALKGCLVRMSDKYMRVQNLMRNPDNEQVGEAVTDTLMDLAAYALIAICLKAEEDEDKANIEAEACEAAGVENFDGLLRIAIGPASQLSFSCEHGVPLMGGLACFRCEAPES